VSGAVLFLIGLPFILYCLQLSLGGDASFARFRAIAGNPLAKLVFLGLIWAYLHHFCAGIRYLLLDLHIGTEKDQARSSSFVVLAVSLALTLVFALKLFGAF
jgi:succinate dehydrogenase / fumarate reductase cytochrome b subunit